MKAGETMGLFAFIASIVLLVILLFGIITLKRVLTRNLTSDDTKDSLDRIRRYFAGKDKKILGYLPFDPFKGI